MSISELGRKRSGHGPELNVDRVVRERYSRAARAREAQLCCPVDYDPKYLAIIPQEIIERDYGCGDPSRYLRPGETVLDLGSGGGKICYIAAQVVGPSGHVIGVDRNDEMLALARKYQDAVAERLGYRNVEFRKGKIQDLQLDLEKLDAYLAEHPVRSSSDWLALEEHAAELRRREPMIADESVDVIVSNCVLNLVNPEDRKRLFAEMHRVLRRGGRAVISDIVSDEDVPPHLQSDPDLWSGCISGAFREDRFLAEFEEAEFYGIRILQRGEKPWAVVEGIEFRSMTVEAFKGKEGPCLERNQAVIYRGPWKAVIDDDGHKLVRGQRMAVCDKTFRIYCRPPYAEQIIPVPPAEEVPLEAARPFDCCRDRLRAPEETKGKAARSVTILPDEPCCGSDDCC